MKFAAVGFLVVLGFAGAARGDDLCANTTNASAACDQAIAGERDPLRKSGLLTTRAYARDAAPGADVFRKSLADLGEAIRLAPNNADALHERAYIFNELGEWQQAKQDLDAQIRLLPAEPAAYDERAMSRFNLGDLQGTFEDRTMQIRLASTPSGYLAHARAAMWLGRFDVAGQDITRARALGANDRVAATAADVIAAQLSLWRRTSAQGAKTCDPASGPVDYHNQFLIGDCTRAFLYAASAQQRAAALSARSLAWITTMNDMTGFIDDSKIAAAFDPNNPSLRSNLGFAYLRAHKPGAAIRQFDAAIALAPDFANTAGRAQAKLNAGDLEGAETDAKLSLGYQPNRIALTVLGDAAYARSKTFDKAQVYWLQALNDGPPDDGLIRRLGAAGVAIPQTSAHLTPPKSP